MSSRKIINDPIYGLISYPFEEIYELIEHPYFQRLRRISQMGLSTYVYPSATHTRFSHALGAVHLMTKAIASLRLKGIEISDAEYLGVCQAILLHDIGHGPFSHGLEGLIYPKHHEDISLDIMQELNQVYGGGLALGIQIFQNKYPKQFLHQLVSSQLDMDRMDYLTRDSFHTGVAEGVIGYDRLISMMHVVDDELVLEEKAIFSIEKFLVARHIMYWQVYLHKTSIVAERMLKEYVTRLHELIKEGQIKSMTSVGLVPFLEARLNGTINDNNYLEAFTSLDDVDILSSVKESIKHPDPALRYLSTSILHRRLHKLFLSDNPISSDLIAEKRQNAVVTLKEYFPNHPNIENLVQKLIYQGQESNQAYNNTRQTIRVLRKDGFVTPLSEVLNTLINVKKITKYYLCYPK